MGCLGKTLEQPVFFCCLLRREQESRRHFQVVFARVVREKLMHLRGEIRRERCRLQASRWCRSGCSFPPARRSGTAKSSPAGKSVSSWVPPRWVVRGKGLSCGHDERIHHLCYGRKYALFISEALFGDGGKDSLRGQKKSTDSIEPMLIWRRVRDLNPRWGISPHTISSRAP